MPSPMSLGVSHPVCQLFLARLVCALKTHAPNECALAICRENGYAVTDIFSLPLDRDSPDNWIITNAVEDSTLIIMSGIASAQSAINLVDGYGLAEGFAPVDGVNLELYRIALLFMTQLGARNYEPRGNVYAVGYSLGGGILPIVMEKLKQTQPRLFTQLLTLGSPKLMRANYLARFQAPQWIALSNDTDPVPFIPPRQQDAPFVYFTLTNRAGEALQSWVHAGSRFTLFVNGTTQLQAYSATLPNNVSLSLLGWVSGLLTSPFEGHQIQEYVVRLAQRVSNMPAAMIQLQPQEPIVVVPPPQEEARRELNLPVVPVELPPDLPPVAVTVNVPRRPRTWRIRRGVRRWDVVSDTTVAATGLAKRQAKRMARHLNSMPAIVRDAERVDVQVLLDAAVDAVYDPSA